jgi:hypothetical protein
MPFTDPAGAGWDSNTGPTSIFDYRSKRQSPRYGQHVQQHGEKEKKKQCDKLFKHF